MKFETLFKNIKTEEIYGDTKNIEIEEIAVDSRKKTKNSVFVCLKGLNSDSHNFAEEAKQNGAVLLVVLKKVDCSLPQVVVKDTRAALSLLAANFFGNPAGSLKIVGITGTNGKTSTTYICKSIFEEHGAKVGLIGTEGSYIGDEFVSSSLTTPDPIELHNLFLKMKDAGCEYVFMEVSAHAIDLKKIEGINFEAGVLTNITQDHLDYFLDMENYAGTKISFLKNENVKCAIACSDDDYFIKTSKACGKKLISFGIENPADIFSTNEKVVNNKSCFVVNSFDNIYEIKTRLIGKFNIKNILGAFAVCKALGIPNETAVKALEKIQPVKGRFNIIDLGKNRKVIIDYAHTPDGLEKILSEAKMICPQPIIALFGASGNRDRAKRPIMGEIAEKYSDFIVLTSDNPKYEKPEFIISEITKGLKKSNHIIIPDRRIAVAIALEYLAEGGTLVLCGKGIENYQDINGIKMPYNDYDEVLKFIRNENLTDLKERLEEC